MRNFLTLIVRRSVDVLIVGLIALSLYLVLRPESEARNAWARHRSEMQARKNLGRLWDAMVVEGSLLSGAKGDADLIEFSDYECPFCRRASASVDSAAAGGAGIIYLNFPIPSHAMAEGAAISALCAERSGRFREMHIQLMTTSAWQRDSNWTREALGAGIADTAAFTACRGSVDIRRKLERQIAFAESLHVHATPTFATRAALHAGFATASRLDSLVSGQ